MFSIDDGDSFRHIEQVWRPEVMNHSEKNDVKIILIGNKDDLHEERINLKSTSEQYAEIHGMKFIEMSAIKGDDYQKVNSVLREAAAEIVRQRGIISMKKDDEKIDLHTDKPEPAPSQPSPAPVRSQPSPAPVRSQPSPAPVRSQPSPASVLSRPGPAPAVPQQEQGNSWCYC